MEAGPKRAEIIPHHLFAGDVCSSYKFKHAGAMARLVPTLMTMSSRAGSTGNIAAVGVHLP
jgi:hypothetical protein